MRPGSHQPCGDLAEDHVALVRRLACLQARISQMVLAFASREEALQAQVLRLRAAQIVSATEQFWATRTARRTGDLAEDNFQAGRASPRSPLRGGPMQQAHAVICQTGCQGHGHPWLSDGQCGLTGEGCDRLHPPD